jgi:hypothetical protein
LGAGGDGLAGNTPSDPNADAQRASNGLRLHSDYDGSSAGRGAAFLAGSGNSQLLSAAVGSMVE